MQRDSDFPGLNPQREQGGSVHRGFKYAWRPLHARRDSPVGKVR